MENNYTDLKPLIDKHITAFTLLQQNEPDLAYKLATTFFLCVNEQKFNFESENLYRIVIELENGDAVVIEKNT